MKDNVKTEYTLPEPGEEHVELQEFVLQEDSIDALIEYCKNISIQKSSVERFPVFSG